MSKGVLAIVSGFSGAGKGTVMQRLMAKYDNYALSISATTRLPRKDETDGIQYFFLTKEEFETMIAEDALIEYAKYSENYYGTPRAYVKEKMESGQDVILEIEMQGAMKVKEKMPDVVLIFIAAPSVMELRNRLVGRGTEDEEQVNRRFEAAKREVGHIEDYDYLLINEDADVCADEVHRIIQCERNHIVCAENKVENYASFIEKMRKEFSAC
ncbi:MAG: guanylate kinase [Blautia sp.]|nr:guanylate kinase [Blautia sp.]